MQPLEYATPAETPRRLSREHRLSIILAGYAIASIPAGFLFGTHSSWLLAAIYLGQFPSYGNPDPKSLPAWITSAELFMVPGMALVPGIAWLITWRLRRRWPELMVILPVVLAVGAWVWVFADPLGAFEWYAD